MSIHENSKLRNVFGVITICLQLSRVLEAACPSGELARIFRHSGIIRAGEGYSNGDECVWKIFAPREKRDHRIIVNITRIKCEKNLIIEGEDFCQHKPKISRIYIPDSCKQDCRRSNCRKIKKYPLTISYGRYATDHGFLIRFGYEPCSKAPKTVPSRKIPTTPTTIVPTATTDIVRPTSGRNTTLDHDATSASQRNLSDYEASSASPTARLATSSVVQTSISPSSEVSLAVIISPIAAVLIVSFLLAVIVIKIWRMKHKQEQSKKQEEVNGTMQSCIPTVNVIDVPIYETLTKRNPTQTFENQAYQTLPRKGAGGSYAENNYGTVFQPTSDDQKEGEDTQTTQKHIYEQLNSEPSGVDNKAIVHEYDSVASESGNEDSFEEDSSTNGDP